MEWLMNKTNRSNLVVGLLLILLGVWLLINQFMPGFEPWVTVHLSWPFLVIGAGFFVLFLGLLLNIPEMAIPACIVGGIGCLLYWQNMTGNWQSWAYVWALIPGFSGIGTIIAGIWRGQPGPAIRSGGGSIIFSLILFAIMASFLGGWHIFGPYWPVLFILLGIWILVRQFIRF
jgi:hypothetical protein